MSGTTLSEADVFHKDYIKDGGTLEIVGTFVGTLTLQKFLQNGTWNDVKTYTAPATEKIDTGNDMTWFRIGFTAYTSGSAYVEFS